jgi:RNA polymerase sigma factor (sigma-70 family)
LKPAKKIQPVLAAGLLMQDHVTLKTYGTATMTPSGEFEQLFEEWRAGSTEALGGLMRHCTERVRVAVRHRLNRRLRKDFDSLDFVQDVWASVAAIPPGARTLASPDALIGFLVRVAEYKVIEAARRRFRTKKRDISREEAMPTNPEMCGAAIFSHEPSPSQLAIRDERLQQLLRQLPTEQRDVLERLSQGATQSDVAEATGISLRSIQRIVQRLRSRPQ